MANLGGKKNFAKIHSGNLTADGTKLQNSYQGTVEEDTLRQRPTVAPGPIVHIRS